MYSTSHPFFHVERENQPDFEDQHRTTWHLNSEIPVQRTKKYFDAAEHVCGPLALHYLLVPSLEYVMKMRMVWSGVLQVLIFHQLNTEIFFC